MQYDVIEDVFGTNRNKPDKPMRLLVHVCTCADTSDHPPARTSAEIAGNALSKMRLRMLRELKGVVTAIYLGDSFTIVIEGGTFTWAELKADAIAAATHSVVDEHWGKQAR